MTVTHSGNRQRIVEAARQLFYQQGYEATSFSDIAREASIPRGNFYYYFKSKDEILDSVIESWLEHVHTALRSWERETSDPRQRLSLFLRFPLQMSEQMRESGCPFGSLNLELHKSEHSDTLREHALRLFETFREWLQTQVEALGYAPAEARMMALQLIGRLQGASVITNSYRDIGYLDYEIRELEAWIRGL